MSSRVSRARYGLIAVSPVPDEQCEVMHLPRLGRLDDERRPRPDPPPHEMMVYGRSRQEARYGRLLFINTLIAQNEHRRAAPDGLLGFFAQGLQRLFQTFRASGGGEEHREGVRHGER